MLKRTITYKDLEGNALTEDFYFHYSTAEATEKRMVLGDDISAKIATLVKSENSKEIITIFKELVADSVGVKSPNGKSFVKTTALRDEFMGSDAWSEMFFWLVESTDNMSAFVNGIFPANMNERASQLVANHEARSQFTVDLPSSEGKIKLPPSIQSPIGAVPRKKFGDYTKEQLLNMSTAEFENLKNA